MPAAAHLGALETEVLLPLPFLQNPLDTIAAGNQARNNHLLESIDPPGRGRDLGSEPAEPHFARRDLQHEVDLGLEPLGQFVNARTSRSEVVSAGEECAANGAMFDPRNPDTHDRSDSGLDLYMTGSRERRRGDGLRAVAGIGPIKRYPSCGAGCPECVAACQDLLCGGPELGHELFALVLEEVSTMLGKRHLCPTGQ